MDPCARPMVCCSYYRDSHGDATLRAFSSATDALRSSGGGGERCFRCTLLPLHALRAQGCCLRHRRTRRVALTAGALQHGGCAVGGGSVKRDPRAKASCAGARDYAA